MDRNLELDRSTTKEISENKKQLLQYDWFQTRELSDREEKHSEMERERKTGHIELNGF